MNNQTKKQIKKILKKGSIKLYGVEIDLTNEQIEQLKNAYLYKNPYNRVGEYEKWYSIVFDYNNGGYSIQESIEQYDDFTNKHFEICNYYNNKEFIKQKTLRMKLNDKLEKFSYENAWDEDYHLDFNRKKYYINNNMQNDEWEVGFILKYRIPGIVYFATEEIAKRAIEEVIKPFMEKHPNFKW